MQFIIGQFWQVVGGVLAGLFIGFLLVLAHTSSKIPQPKTPAVKNSINLKQGSNAKLSKVP